MINKIKEAPRGQGRGKLFVLSASSGTGKTTLARELAAEDHNIVISVSCTTRLPRPNERDGADYFFLSNKDFSKKKKSGGFLEWANVFGSSYGTPSDVVEKNLKSGKDVLLVIDVQGAKQVRKTVPEAVFIFLSPPSIAELKRRLEKRGTDSGAEIRKRLKVAVEELEALNELYLFDYRVVNRDLLKAKKVLKGIVDAERIIG